MEKRAGKITIRDFIESDIPFKVKMINDEKNNQYLHYDLPLEEGKTRSWFKKIKGSEGRLDLTIFYDGERAGTIGLLEIDKKNKKAEYYICVDSSFAGKGIGPVATRSLLGYAFNDMGLNKVYLYTEEDNKKAQHLFEKVGFKKEGLLKDDMIFNGKAIARYAYGLCKDDYYAENTNS